MPRKLASGLPPSSTSTRVATCRLLVVVTLVCGAGIASADQVPTDEPPIAAEIVSAARNALQSGEYQAAADLLANLLASDGSVSTADSAGGLDRADRAEAWRIYGLSLYFLERYEPARLALFQALKLDYEARLDPSQWPPEVVAFCEDVRARNAAELQRYRPKPKKRRSAMLNLVPPLGQLQNGHRTKGVIVGGIALLALAGNVGTFLLLRSWCDPVTAVCQTETGESREGQARFVRTVNLSAGAVFAAVFAYGVIDGFVHYRRKSKRITIGGLPHPSGFGLSARIRF